MNIKEIKELIQLLDESNLTALELQSGDSKVRVEREPAPVMQTGGAVVEYNNNLVSAATPEEERGEKVVSPLVGNFYSAASPDAAPFTQVGQAVKKGQVLCIVEAMKVMNEIAAPTDGVVKKVLAKDGDVVEFGQALFVIE